MSFSVVAPTIADDFGVGMAGVTIPFVLAFARRLRAVGARSPRWPTAATGCAWRCSAASCSPVFSMLVGLAPSIWMLAFCLAGVADRQGVHRAVAHVAARRLLRGRAAAPGVLVLPGRQRGRRAGRRHRRGLRRRGVRLAGAVLRLRRPHARSSCWSARALPEPVRGPRSSSWSASAEQPLEHRGGGPAVARRGLAHVLADRQPAPHLPRAAVPHPGGGGLRHLQHVHLPRRVRPRRVGPGLGASAWSRGRRSWSASSSAPGSA